MERMQITFVLNLFSISICVLGDAVAFFPPEARAANEYQYVHPFQTFQPMYRNAMPQGVFLADDPIMRLGSMEHQDLVPILHTSAANPPHMPERPLEGINYTAAHEVPGSPEESRATKGNYDYTAHGTGSFPSSPSPFGYTPPAAAPGYSPPASSTSYSHPAAPAVPTYSPPIVHHPPVDKFFKPDFGGLIKPVTTKMAGKVSGLIGLVLSLLSSSGESFEMKGFKDILINGIVKPLLVAKGGIKSLISKVTIPLISLLLINLEVLITVWWLWEDCPESKPAYDYKPNYVPAPPAPPAYTPYK